MKIDGSGPVRNTPVRRKKTDRTGNAGGDFAGKLSAGKTSSGAITSGGPVAAADPLLAVQEAADAGHEQTRAKARGNAILDRLDELRLGLLMGFYPKDRLHELLRVVRSQRPKASDRHLAEVLQEIELRAEVELAKLGVDA